MSQSFQALWASNPSLDPNQFDSISCEVRETQLDELGGGDVVIKNEFTGINYKDALAVTGRAKILRNLPLIPGIDCAGIVTESKHPRFKEGDAVLINGANLGEVHCGGLSEYVRVSGDMVLHRPSGLSAKEAMIYGTAGFTAALALHRLEENGLRASKGEVLVTGATGGVGSLALGFLNRKGYETRAWTRRKEHQGWLEQAGAGIVEDIGSKDWSTRPLATAQYASAIDSIGGDILSHIIPRIELWGSVATIGLAQGAKLNTTVYPFILRGVSLLGISSNNCPQGLREELWQEMAGPLKPKNLEHFADQTIGLEHVLKTCESVIESKHLGRNLVQFS